MEHFFDVHAGRIKPAANVSCTDFCRAIEESGLALNQDPFTYVDQNYRCKWIQVTGKHWRDHHPPVPLDEGKLMKALLKKAGSGHKVHGKDFMQVVRDMKLDQCGKWMLFPTYSASSDPSGQVAWVMFDGVCKLIDGALNQCSAKISVVPENKSQGAKSHLICVYCPHADDKKFIDLVLTTLRKDLKCMQQTLSFKMDALTHLNVYSDGRNRSLDIKPGISRYTHHMGKRDGETDEQRDARLLNEFNDPDTRYVSTDKWWRNDERASKGRKSPSKVHKISDTDKKTTKANELEEPSLIARKRKKTKSLKRKLQQASGQSDSDEPMKEDEHDWSAFDF